jgi:DHA2 family multidrug resistance protein
VTIGVAALVDIDKPDLRLLRDADYLGIVLMSVALGSLEYFLEEGARWNWFSDRTIRNCAITSAVTGTLFVIRSLTYAQPVVDLRALGNRNFLLGCILSFVTGIGIFATIYLTPLFLGYVRGFSAWQTGLAVFSTGVASIVGVPIYVTLGKRIDLRWLMMFGMSCFALSMWNFTPITHDWGGRELLFPQAFRGFSQQFAVAPVVSLTLGGLAPERLKLASGLFNLMRNLGGAIGIAACGTILNVRTNLHFLRLAEHLNSSNPTMVQWVDQVAVRETAMRAGDLVHGQAAALKILGTLALREAQTQSYADAFLVIALCFVLATAMVPLMRRLAAPAMPVRNPH